LGHRPGKPEAAAPRRTSLTLRQRQLVNLLAGADQIHRIMKQVDVGSRRAVAEAV